MSIPRGQTRRNETDKGNGNSLRKRKSSLILCHRSKEEWRKGSAVDTGELLGLKTRSHLQEGNFSEVVVSEARGQNYIE